jgi:hypothetical protein
MESSFIIKAKKIVNSPEAINVCSGGETVSGTLLVESTRDFSAPDTDDTSPTVRVQFLAVCNDGTSMFWSGFMPATITSTDNLKVSRSMARCW